MKKDEMQAEITRLKYEVDAIPAIKAERDALMSAADSHKVVRDTLTARLNVLEAAAKLALDALVAESRTTESNVTLVRILTAITSLRQAEVQ